ncbi:MAG: pyruvate kinase, partial [Hyphomonas sp.]|nr:pyruvate kinase [Hyphomonas sp.]
MTENRLQGENAKIVATLGPGSRSPKEVRALADAGVDVFRLNFSHGEHAQHKEALDAVRAAEIACGRPLATLADLQGPKVRVGKFPDGGIRLGFRAEYDLVAAEEADEDDTIPVPHKEIVDMLEAGDKILVDDGKLILTVTKAGKRPKVLAEIPGKLTDKKGFTVRGKALPVRALTDKDRADLDFALSIGVDIVALSFVQTVEDVREVKDIIAGRAPLVSKLEKPAAIQNLDVIVEASDAVMVAR